MNLDKKARLRVEAWIRDELAKFISLNDFDLFFFGSRVTAKKPNASDIDIGVKKKSGGTLPPGVLSHMQEYVRELPILQKIDFVDFGQASEDFQKVSSASQEMFGE